MNNKYDENINKVIKELTSKSKDSRKYQKYNKILAKKYREAMRYKTARTREESLVAMDNIKNKDIDNIKEDLKVLSLHYKAYKITSYKE